MMDEASRLARKWADMLDDGPEGVEEKVAQELRDFRAEAERELEAVERMDEPIRQTILKLSRRAEDAEADQRTLDRILEFLGIADTDIDPVEFIKEAVERMEAAEAQVRELREEWTTVADAHPPPHAVYRVFRPGVGEFHATPCYGMHHPWWVPRNGLTGQESEPDQMHNCDQWAAIRKRREG